MLESLYIGMSGLQGFSRGLRVISNNVTNLNTPGFKGARQQFGDLFYQGMPTGSFNTQYGTGLNALFTSINYQPGEVRQSGNSLDVAVDGDGFFVLRDGAGERYTRAGQFEFNKDGVLVVRGTDHRVMGYDANGALQEISLGGLRVNAAKSTGQVVLQGNLSSTATTFNLDGVKIIDAAGAEHVVKLAFKRNTATTGAWTVDVLEGTATLASGAVRFVDGHPVAGEDSLTFNYTPANAAAQSVTIKLGAEVTSFASGTTSSLVVASQDGYAAGSLTNATFDAAGTLDLSYSNGQHAKGATLALAHFDSPDVLEQVGGNEFASRDPGAALIVRAGAAGTGKISAGQLELSNVDLSAEFSDLIVMQRGYQASSRIVSTANEMLQELFDMKGHR